MDYGLTTVIEFGLHVHFLKRCPQGTSTRFQWRKCFSDVIVCFSDVIVMQSLYSDKFQYVQLWMGYGHQIRTVSAFRGKESIIPPWLVGMSLLCGDNTLKSVHLTSYGWTIVINFRQQVHLLGKSP